MEAKLKVKLISSTPNAEAIVAMAGRLCYSALDIETLQVNLTEDKINEMVNKLGDMGHTSTFEHVSFTFAVEGVSRALTHQLVRHRLASYSQQSQRYVKEEQFDYVVPETIKEAKMEDMFNTMMEIAQIHYNDLLKHGIPAEDARYVLPNATESKIIITMNARELLHFFEKRCCNRAQWEIRAMAKQMLSIVKELYPTIFKNAGPHCVTGDCKEGKLSCINASKA